MRQLRTSLAALIALTLTACAARGPVLDTGSKPEGIGGTISGIVTASGAVPVPGRRITAVDVATGARYETVTAINGGYTIKVPAGKYRLEVELRDTEMLAKQPAETEISASDLDAGRDFVITAKPPPLVFVSGQGN